MSAGVIVPTDPSEGSGGRAVAAHDQRGMVDELAALLAGRRLVALTGAGCSTESGIPDYRGAGRPVRRQPLQHGAFVREASVRQRYWARATVAWARFSAARPNPAHQALAALERGGILRGVITQNVDRLHSAAGSARVVELHGALADVRCLVCARVEARGALQERLLAANPTWLERTAALAPDGDADLPADGIAAFEVPGCLVCEGPLMPDVVFFGGSVPADKTEAAWSLLDEADAVLVVGTSLAVLSGFRYARGAAERGLPIAIVNQGPTRADSLSTLRVDAAAGVILPALAGRLLGGEGRPFSAP